MPSAIVIKVAGSGSVIGDRHHVFGRRKIKAQ
jgi:hypothetical protein